MALQKGYIRTRSGLRIYPLKPDPDSIFIQDIAHHASHVNRYSGATFHAYSVGLHSLTVARLARERNYSLRLRMAALLHDASEVFGLGDVSAPVKDQPEFEFYRKAEAPLQSAVYRKFLGSDLTREETEKIRQVDLAMFCAEWCPLMGEPEPGIPAPAEDAAAIYFNHATYWNDPVLVRALFMDDFHRVSMALAFENSIKAQVGPGWSK